MKRVAAPGSRVVALYLVTGPTGRQYVGITTKSVDARWTQHSIDAKRGQWKSALHEAIRKYGRDAFTVEKLAVFDSWEAACAAEVAEIRIRGTFGDGGYNLTRGGDGKLGCKHTDEFKSHIGSVHTGRQVSDVTRERLRRAHQRRTAEQRAELAEKMAAANARRTPEERSRISEAISASKRGKKRPPEIVAKAIAAKMARAAERKKAAA